jgi:hypothetical protein
MTGQKRVVHPVQLRLHAHRERAALVPRNGERPTAASGVREGWTARLHASR